MTATRIGRIMAVAAAVGGWTLTAALLWRTAVPGDLQVPALAARDVFPPAVLAETDRFASVLRGLWLASLVAELALLGLLAWHGPALARRLRGGGIARGVALLAATLGAAWLVGLPFGAAAHWWRRRHDLTTLGYLDWLLAPWLGLLVTLAIACLAVAAGMVLARRLGTRWWVAGGPLLAAFGAVVVLVQPLVFAPRFEPLEDRALAREIARLGAELGVPGIEVRVRRVHDRTRRANASLHGIGPTRRLILWDTLLDGRFTEREVRFVAAHELAHAARRHLWKGLAWFALLAPLPALALAHGTRPRGGLGEPGAVPLAVLVAVCAQLALL
ncbi:MAG: M48 family metalloprotease, partial [Thermoleophilia bacterium]|nr:M48 family metalloprotease [Thermoleophilia bacterium]